MRAGTCARMRLAPARVALLFSLLCLFVYPTLAAADFPPIDQVIRDSKAAHEACRQGRARQLATALDVGAARPRGGTPLQEKYDVKYYRLEMKFDRANAIVSGNVTMTAEVVAPLAVCQIDCYWIVNVDSIKLNGEPASWWTDSRLLHIDLGRTYAPGEVFQTQVFHHGVEEQLAWAALFFDEYDGQPVIGNLSEPFYACAWWPCKDYPNDKADSLDIYITYPANLFCSSNGNLISDVDHGDGFRTTHWSVRYPIATYLVSVAIAEFTHWREWAQRTPTDSLPVDYWVYPGLVPQIADAYAFTVPAIDTLSRIFGRYPFPNEKYAMSNFTWGGAMEHQTNTSMSPGMSENVMTIVHELSHQWWGDMITCRDWHHIWLNEGFATYSEALMVEAMLGTDALHSYMNAIEYYGPGSIYVRDTTYAWNILDIIVYDKGGWVLHMLRGVIGDEAFFTGLRNYGASPLKYGTAVTEDFQYYMEQSSGQDLDWFFSEWVYGYGNPQYEYMWQSVPSGEGGYRLDLIIKQVQTEFEVFAMPIQVMYRLDDDSEIYDTLWNDRAFMLYQREFAQNVAEVHFDPLNWILKGFSEQPFALTIVSRDLPAGEETKPYYCELAALGGVPPYNWTFLGGDIPYGLNFTGGEQGIIEGVPTYPATFYFTIQLTDASTPPAGDVFGFALKINPTVHVGDCDCDGRIALTDAVYLVNYIFASGPAPNPPAAGDLDCSGFVNISDAVHLILYLFDLGPGPCR